MKLFCLSLGALLLASTTFCIEETNDKNQKPSFKSCSMYKPEIEEEQPRGEFVLQVKAEDDDPPESGGTITYKIVQRVGERKYFEINNNTGEITTLIQFDRDEPARQKEVYLTVQATDNGRPPLADVCTIKIKIRDVNDNDPSFDTSEYRTSVAEDTRENSIVANIFAYDIDDGENSKLSYSLAEEANTGFKFKDYFAIDSEVGVLRLIKSVRGMKDKQMQATVFVQDNGTPPRQSQASIVVKIVGSDKRAPTIKASNTSLQLEENFIDYSAPLFKIEAEPNIADSNVIFELVKGKTDITNKDQTFILDPKSDNTAEIKLARPLDYEKVTEYTLTVRVKNKNQMETTATYTVKVLDVNDEVPTFIDVIKGSVIENEKAGQQVMVVKAVDKDGTSANNIVKYSIDGDGEDLFEIDPDSGTITSKDTFDREEKDLYHIKVKAYDNSPSALFKNNLPNIAYQQFQITVEDRNDNKPIFTQPTYLFEKISEKSDKGSVIGEVKAEDKDTASLIKYKIEDGDPSGTFAIEELTGRIKLAGKLDFETTEEYKLTIIADDGFFNDTAIVIIKILDENDELPQFEEYNKTIQLEEEKEYYDCILILKAFDPDIKDRNADQKIIFKVDENNQDYIQIDNSGCVRITKTLDRDPPDGASTRQVIIHAYDNNGVDPTLSSSTDFNIELKDINDNAPYLSIVEVVWNENHPPGKITTLTANDNDSIENGPPFKFSLGSISADLQGKFEIRNDDELYALVEFDREERKYYDIPITIEDSGKPETQISYNNNLRVIIGDMNDNPAEDGESEIFVYKYEGLQEDIDIGRVYVTDPDDWDLNDKTFVQTDLSEYFFLSKNDNGMIKMRYTTPEGTYTLNYKVTETREPVIPTHTVNAKVTIQIKLLPEEAVRKSGSIRLKDTTAEELIEKNQGGISKKDAFQFEIAKILNTSKENVDVFTILPTPNHKDMVDIRFSAHGSPYYYPEKLNNLAVSHQAKLENDLDATFYMISINECVDPNQCPNEDCSNDLIIHEKPAFVFTNKTSFVGVKAVTIATCNKCQNPKPVKECYNGGTLLEETTCQCQAGYEGPNCEILGIGFSGGGTAVYKPFNACNNTDISFLISPDTKDGLVFYLGPLVAKQAELSKDFISLELQNGYPIVKVNLGNDLIKVKSNKSLSDGSQHKINIHYTTNDVQLEVDDCKSNCMGWKSFEKEKRLIRTNGPLQLGGMKFPFQEEAKSLWSDPPLMDNKFAGCIKNFTHNGQLYNLGQPSDSVNAMSDCQFSLKQAVTLGRDSLVAILVCIAVMIVLMLVLVVYRRKHDSIEKEIDDTRENIINYEDEGGGESDTNYDLSVFARNNENLLQAPNDVGTADIGNFLDNKKGNCDKDPDNLPYDDVRHYAYQGDGNSTGSLSSLASCTDDGDLNFSHISSFGPRFRKLANIYGEDEDDEESENGHEEAWC